MIDMYLNEFYSFRGWPRKPKGIIVFNNVYGGYVGTKISRHKPDSVWEWLKMIGVTRIIDLRYDYMPEAFKSRCEEFGIKYFSYPIHNDPETIVNMVENFCDFSDMIMEGHFYMMGHRKAYTALCTYWVFYAADKGIAPPPIRGYLQWDGHNTNKIMRVLNAFYKYKTESDGVEPMPSKVFKQRKKTIDELSKM